MIKKVKLQNNQDAYAVIIDNVYFIFASKKEAELFLCELSKHKRLLKYLTDMDAMAIDIAQKKQLKFQHLIEQLILAQKTTAINQINDWLTQRGWQPPSTAPVKHPRPRM